MFIIIVESMLQPPLEKLRFYEAWSWPHFIVETILCIPKVGSNSLAGKEQIVLNGLSSARKGIDDFLSLFPKEEVLAAVARIEQENALNEKEFDKTLNQGVGILNPKPVQS